MEALLPVGSQLFLLVLLGWGLRMAHCFSAVTLRELAAFTVNVCCPLLVLASVAQMKRADPVLVGSWMLAGAGIYALLPFAARGLAACLRADSQETRLYQFMLIFPNTSLLGFPVVQAVFGDDAVFYTALLHLPFDVLVYSYGVWLLCGQTQGFAWRKLCNPGLWLTLFALLVYLLQLPLPACIVAFSAAAGALTTPLSMLIIGASLAGMEWRKTFLNLRLYAMAGIRLLLLPAIIYYVLLQLGLFDGWLLGIAVVTFGMPVGSMLVMMAVEYQNHEQLAVQAVSLTTAGLVLSIPVLLYAAGQ